MVISCTSILVQDDPCNTGPKINPGLMTQSSNFSSSKGKINMLVNPREWGSWGSIIKRYMTTADLRLPTNSADKQYLKSKHPF